MLRDETIAVIGQMTMIEKAPALEIQIVEIGIRHTQIGADLRERLGIARQIFHAIGFDHLRPGFVLLPIELEQFLLFHRKVGLGKRRKQLQGEKDWHLWTTGADDKLQIAPFERERALDSG